jgi:hypothetical protein
MQAFLTALGEIRTPDLRFRGELVAKLFAEHYAPIHRDPAGIQSVDDGGAVVQRPHHDAEPSDAPLSSQAGSSRRTRPGYSGRFAPFARRPREARLEPRRLLHRHWGSLYETAAIGITQPRASAVGRTSSAMSSSSSRRSARARSARGHGSGRCPRWAHVVSAPAESGPRRRPVAARRIDSRLSRRWSSGAGVGVAAQRVW